VFASIINESVDGKDPVIMEDKEYPDWLFKLVDPVSFCFYLYIPEYETYIMCCFIIKAAFQSSAVGEVRGEWCRFLDGTGSQKIEEAGNTGGYQGVQHLLFLFHGLNCY
jgi:hypothetical protein